MKKSKGAWALAVLAVLLVGAGIAYADLLRAAFQRNPIPRSAASVARGRLLFQERCAVCHGPAGRGDGPAAAGFPHKPDDLSTIAPPPVFPDGIVAYRIVNGVDLMPAFRGSLAQNDVWDLLNYIRSLAQAK